MLGHDGNDIVKANYVTHASNSFGSLGIDAPYSSTRNGTGRDSGNEEIREPNINTEDCAAIDLFRAVEPLLYTPDDFELSAWFEGSRLEQPVELPAPRVGRSATVVH